MIHRVRLALVIALLVLTVIFILQNTEVVTVRFLMLEMAVSRVILILITLLIGIVIGYTLALMSRRARVKP